MTKMIIKNTEVLTFELSPNSMICKVFILEIKGKGWKEKNLHSWMKSDQ